MPLRVMCGARDPVACRAAGVLLALALMLAGAGLAGCQGRLAHTVGNDPLAAALAEANPTFRLRQPVGTQPVQQTRFAADLVLPNCTADEPATTLYTEPLTLEADLLLQDKDLPPSLKPLRGVLAAMVRESYASAGLYPPLIDREVRLAAAPGQQQHYRLVWVETWHENSVEVLVDDELAAEVPMRLLASVVLTADAGEAVPCDEAPSGGADSSWQVLAPEQAPEIDPAKESGTAHETPEACQAPVPATPGQELVARYVTLLDAGDHAAAYALLSEGYRLRLPYRQYQAGYEPVSAIELCTLASEQTSGDTESIRATLRLTLDTHDGPREEIWVARYEVTRRAGADGQAAINAVTMHRAALSDE